MPCGKLALRARWGRHGRGCCVRLVTQSIIDAERDESDNHPNESEVEHVAHIVAGHASAGFGLRDLDWDISSFVDIINSLVLGAPAGIASSLPTGLVKATRWKGCGDHCRHNIEHAQETATTTEYPHSAFFSSSFAPIVRELRFGGPGHGSEIPISQRCARQGQ